LTENIQLIKFGPLEVTLDGIMVTGFWGIRGFIDKMFGGVGSRRGRTNRHEIIAETF
jgi:hypothetical protein